MKTCETQLFSLHVCLFSLSDLISLTISCEREAEVRAQAPLKGLFVLCVVCISFFVTRRDNKKEA